MSRLWVSTDSHVNFTHSLTSVTEVRLRLPPAIFTELVTKITLVGLIQFT